LHSFVTPSASPWTTAHQVSHSSSPACNFNYFVTIANKVVKIAFWLVKSYDFTSQNMLCVLNRLKKSKMGEIGWKIAISGSILWL
jgi:hypothetical protein